LGQPVIPAKATRHSRDNKNVIPAKAGIQAFEAGERTTLDSRFRGNDG